MAASRTFSHYPSWPVPLSVQLTTTPPHPCVYLPSRATTLRAFLTNRMPGETYHHFMNAGFRRSGRMIYQPACAGCRQCVPMRVAVDEFQPSKSQRRVLRKNVDVKVEIAPPVCSDEKFELYLQYLQDWHNREPAGESRENFEDFLYRSPVETIELSYRDAGGKLLAVGICDVCEQSLSSVYCYFDPSEARRGLGTFTAMYEIQHAKKLRIPHYYLGYWINGCATMQYKSNFHPAEFLGTDGIWRREKQQNDDRLGGPH